MARTSILVLSLLCATVVAAVAAPVPESLLELPHGDEFPMRLRGGAVWERVKSLAAVRDPAASFPAQWFDQKLNHSDPDSPTFKQKFYVNDMYFNATSGPIFLGIRGEGPVSGPPGGWVNELAQKHQALSISLEHRFYGDSVPGNDFSVANLAYLNLDDVLMDYVTFIDWYKQKLGNDNIWFTFGGSYSGALSAFFRLKYPDYTTGSLSSSGVVNTIFDFYQFDQQVATSAGPACAAVLRETTAKIEAEQQAGVNVRALFGAPNHLSDGDFYYMVADSGAQAVQYGHRLELCHVMQSAKAAGENLATVFANLTTTLWGAGFASNCFYDTECLISDPSRWQPTSRAWRWQKCYQMAYLQAAPAQNSIRSQAVNLSYCVDQCHQIFGDSVNPKAGSAAVLAEFKAGHAAGSNIFFSNGGDDPWQQAAVKATISPSEPEFTAHCADCGHCGDLAAPKPTDPPQLTQQRNLEASYIASWLSAAQQ